jgi:predicted amidohydrolase
MAFLIGANTVINNGVEILHTSFETVTGNTQSTQVKIVASDAAAGDFFGASVAVGSGRIVVGSPEDDDNGTSSGSAYIFNLSGTLLAKIKASDAAAGDFFGDSSIAVGCGRIVVGSSGDDDNGNSSGSAYIFDLNGAQLAKIKPSDGAGSDTFGVGVAVGSGRIVVGSYLDDDNGTNSGSAYIFDLNGTQLAKIKPSDGATFDYFGESVAVGCGRIVVGSASDDDNGTDSGSAYIFDLNGTQLAKIKASDAAAGVQFGNSVAVGSGRIIVGSFVDDDNGSNSGSAYIFDLNGTQLAKIKPSDGAADDRFGVSVSVGSGRIVVGSQLDDDNGSSSGSAYIFDLNGTQLAKIVASDGADSDQFGYSVSVGSGRIVVGSWRDDDNGSNSGSAYIYKLPETMDTYFENVLDTFSY